MKKERQLGLLGWSVMPIIFIWLSVNYMFGLKNKPEWDQMRVSGNEPVLGMESNIVDMRSPYKWDGEGKVTLWFDDGWMSQYQVAAPILKERNLAGALAVSTKLVGFEAYLTWPQIERMAYDGWEITSHSRNHNCEPWLLSEDILRDEVAGSKKDLEVKGFLTDHFVLPCGEMTEELTAVIREHYVSMRTSEEGINELPINDPYAIKAVAISPTTSLNKIRNLLAETSRENGWLILMFHQIDDMGEDYSVTKVMFESILDEVEASELEVILPSQALYMVVE